MVREHIDKYRFGNFSQVLFHNTYEVMVGGWVIYKISNCLCDFFEPGISEQF